MRTIELSSEPSKTMKKSSSKIAIFSDFGNFCYVMRGGKIFHCAVVDQLELSAALAIVYFALVCL